MFQPNPKQWRVIWTIAAALVLFWPAAGTRSLAIKAVNFLADPFHELPVLPPPLPLGLGDDADVVAVHDANVQAYWDAYDSSWLIRARMALRDWDLPLDAATRRQVLIALAVMGALLVWRLGGARPGTRDDAAGA